MHSVKKIKHKKNLLQKVKGKKRIKQNIIFILIILLSIIVISCKFFIKDSQPFGINILQVSSNSMLPKLKKGDFIIIKKQKEYNIGDIITYSISEGNNVYYVTHRIIKKYENEYVTKGDANNKEDNYKVYENVIKGKVIFP